MIKTASCIRCNTTLPTIEMVKTALAKRGGRNAYMCQHCASQNEHYHATNNKNRGTQKVNQVFVGIELETSYTNEYARNTLFEYGMIPTHDCSLTSDGNGSRYGYDGNTCEYVSGIWQGLNIASKLAKSIENLMQDNHLKINNSCGTHFHISINAMKNEYGEQIYMDYIRRFYHSLFVPLCEAMQNNPEKTEALFGRYFDYHYCNAINEATNAGSRYNFINVTNASNIEFRLNKYQNAKQFQNLMKMEVEIVEAIVTNFCEHFNDTDIDSRRYKNIREYRKHKANVTAKKLVKIFEKYSNI